MLVRLTHGGVTKDINPDAVEAIHIGYKGVNIQCRSFLWTDSEEYTEMDVATAVADKIKQRLFGVKP